ncbi:cell wall-binding repeat-containing protein [Peptostreptococcus sp.]|uniref:cell wall-binding repeat-containing protein n=1 Tax=Peptostreptococcus sp. TaxID=1262 RepID=UPI002FCA0CF5
MTYKGVTVFETANKIALNYFKKADNVILVNSDAIPDALSVAPYAKKLNAPVLLTKSDSLDKKTKETLEQLNSKKIILIGGEKSLSKNLENNLKKDYTVERISGSDRINTSLQIANKMGQPIKNAFVVNGYTGLADAAGTGGIAAKLNVPLVFTDKNIDRYKNSLNDLNINNVFLIGGTYNLPEGFNNVVNSERIAGSNRRDTNAKLIEKFFGKDYNSAFIAKDGSNNESELIDSVTIGGVAGLKNMPIFLGSKTAGLTNEQLEQLKASAPKHIVGVGGGNKTAGNQIEKQLPNAQIDISEITSKPSEDEEVPSSGGGGGGGSSTNTEQDKKNLLIKAANEHLDGVVKGVNNNSAIKKVLNMQFDQIDQKSNKTTITVISDEIPEDLDEITNTGFIDGILNTPNLESYRVVDGENGLVKLKTDGKDLTAQELKEKILQDVMKAISKQLTTSDDTTAAEETSNTDASTDSTNDETVLENEKTNNTKSAYDIVKENIGKIDGKSVIVNANYNDGKTKASVEYEFIFKVDKNQIILSKANTHLKALVGNVAKNETINEYATISFDPDSMVTDVVSKEITKLPNAEDLKAISGTGFITGLKKTPNLVSYSIGDNKTDINVDGNESTLKESIINNVLAQFEGTDIPEKKTITVTANYDDGDVKLSQDYKFNFDFSNMKKAIEKEENLNNKKKEILSNSNKHLASLVNTVADNDAVSKYATISFDPDSMVTDVVSKEITKLPNAEDLKAISGTGFITGLKKTPNLVSYSIGDNKTDINVDGNESTLKESIINDVLAQFEGTDLNNIPEKKTITVTANFEDGDVKLSQDYKFNFDFSKIKEAINKKEIRENTEKEATSKINTANDNVSIKTDSEKKKIKLEIKNLSFFESNSNELLEKITSTDRIKAIKLNGKEINISDLNGETLHKELLEAIDYNNIDDYREFFKSSQNPEISNKVNNPSPENIKMINNFIKSSSNSDGKTVPIYFLLKDETGEFLSSEYKMDFTFDDSLKSTVDETIKKSIAEQDKVILDTRKFFLQQSKVKYPGKKFLGVTIFKPRDIANDLIFYNSYPDNLVEIAINEEKNNTKLGLEEIAGTGLKTTEDVLSDMNYLNSLSINENIDKYGKSDIFKIKDAINKEFGIKDTSLKNYINKSFNLNLYSSNNKIKFKRTFKVSITNNFEKLKSELEKVNFGK